NASRLEEADSFHSMSTSLPPASSLSTYLATSTSKPSGSPAPVRRPRLGWSHLVPTMMRSLFLILSRTVADEPPPVLAVSSPPSPPQAARPRTRALAAASVTPKRRTRILYLFFRWSGPLIGRWSRRTAGRRGTSAKPYGCRYCRYVRGQCVRILDRKSLARSVRGLVKNSSGV